MKRSFDFNKFDALCAETLGEVEQFDPHLGDKIMTMEYQLHRSVMNGLLTEAEAEEHLAVYTAWLEGQETDEPTLRCLGQLGMDL